LNGVSNSIAYYIQTAYRLPWLERLWKPYYRLNTSTFEKRYRIPARPQREYFHRGMRYDVSSFATIKLEYRNMGRPGQPRINGAFAQTSFTF